MPRSVPRVEILGAGNDGHFTLHIPGKAETVDVVVTDLETNEFLTSHVGQSVEGKVYGKTHELSIDPYAPTKPIPAAPTPIPGDYWEK